MSILSLLTLWLKPITLGVREEMPLSRKKKLYITNTASFWLLVLGPLFIILNVVNGQHGLIVINSATTAIGALCLLLSWRGWHWSAAILLLSGSSIAFFLSGLLFNNGMEYTLLVVMMGAVFMFERSWLRIPFALGGALGFLVVRCLHLTGHWNAAFPPFRYAINLGVFLCCYYWILEIFRTVTGNYHREIEQKNRDLAESRRQLDRDHAALTRLTEELRTANTTKEKLFTLVAHDARAPVANLKSVLDLLEDTSLSREEFQQIVPTLRADLDHTHTCLETLLTWSASQFNAFAPVFSAVDLHTLAGDCIDLMLDIARRKKLTIHNHIPEGATVRADANQLAAILRNLLSNAIKFTPQGGSVSFHAVEEGQADWSIKVVDTGIGIAPDHLKQLLESDHTHTTPGTENERGLGLGLRICREFIQTHRSTLRVESAPGCGTTFAFILPDASAKGDEAAIPALDLPNPLSWKNAQESA